MSNQPLLTVLTQGRNDSYMGNFCWRLAQVLNNYARNLRVLNAEADVEILVADWGSEIPLYRTLELTDEAREIVKFLIVPPQVAAVYDGDAGYSGVHPINSVARRAGGRAVMFADSDVYLPLDSTARLLHQIRADSFDGLSLNDHFFWASKFHVPNEIVRQNLPLPMLDDYIEKYGSLLLYDPLQRVDFRGAGVCLLTLRDTWHMATGWDERLIYWGWFDIDLHRRLCRRYRWDLLERHGVRAYHLEHYSARFNPESQRQENQQKVNKNVDPTNFAPNPPNWGLADHELEIVNGFGDKAGKTLRESFVVSSNIASPGEPALAHDIYNATPLLRVLGTDTLFARLDEPANPGLLEKLLSACKPKTVCQIVEHYPVGFEERLAKAESVTEVVSVGSFDRSSWSFSSSLVTGLEWRALASPYESYVRSLVKAGMGEKISVFRSSITTAKAQFLLHKKRFDLVLFPHDIDLEGGRRDILPWLELLSRSGAIYGRGGVFYPGYTRLSEDIVAACSERGLLVFNFLDHWLIATEPVAFELAKTIDRQIKLEKGDLASVQARVDEAVKIAIGVPKPRAEFIHKHLPGFP